MPSSELARNSRSSPEESGTRPSSAVASMSTEPLQSSGASADSSAPSSHWSFQSSTSISSMVPSKYWISMVPSSSSRATTSNSAPPFKRSEEHTSELQSPVH